MRQSGEVLLLLALFVLVGTLHGTREQKIRPDLQFSAPQRCQPDRSGIVRDTDSLPKNGVLMSPNYPDPYPKNQRSTQIIQVAEGKTIHFAWTDFNTEYPNDYVQIQDENGTDLTPFAKLSGMSKSLPPPVWGSTLPPSGVSSSNVVHVKFSTNHEHAFTGWRLEWKEINNDSEAGGSGSHEVEAEAQLPDLTLSSSGGAGELQGNSSGVFQYSHKYTERHAKAGEKGPVYQQRHDGDGDGDLMYRLKQFWYVGPTLGTECGAYLRAPGQGPVSRVQDPAWIKVSGSKEPPPARGWQYYEGRDANSRHRKAEQYDEQAWTTDSNMKLWGPSPSCKTVVVEITGEAAEQWLSGGSQEGTGTWSGPYIALANKWNKGRQVYQHESGAEKYLFVPSSQTTTWMIGSTIGCVSKAWISSGSAGATCPGSPRTPTNTRFGRMEWVYWNGDGWRENKITVEW